MYLRRLFLGEFIKPHEQADAYPELPTAFKVCSVSASKNPADAEFVEWVRILQANERSAFRNGMSTLLKLANAGRKLETHYGPKECHEAHRFNHANQVHVVWRIRRGDLRILFYYGAERIILITDSFPKHRDKLTKAQKLKSEQTIKAFVDAKKVKYTRGDRK
ncbi:MAG TPA: hypothetical protein PLN31_17300 [Azoarcus taiwanensis]|nr:hypothetical protein [Azoarcus taiwanensis]